MKENMVKITLSVLGGVLSNFAQKHVEIIILVMVAIVFDTITGIVATLAEGKKLSSAKGLVGLWKKVALVLALGFGCFLDAFLPYCMGRMNLTMPQFVCFGMIFGCYIILNESISILENLNRTNPEVLPGWAIRLLTDMKKKIEKGDGIIEEVEDNED